MGFSSKKGPETPLGWVKYSAKGLKTRLKPKKWIVFFSEASKFTFKVLMGPQLNVYMPLRVLRGDP